MPRSEFFVETLYLAVLTSAAKIIDFLFKAHVSKLVGPEGAGLCQMILAFYLMLQVFAGFGITASLAKIISEKIALNRCGEIKNSVKISIFITSALAIFIIILVGINSNFVSEHLLNDERLASGLKFMLPSVLFVQISACIKNYFYAVKKVLQPASSEFLEQFTKISAISYFLKLNIDKTLAEKCAGIFFGYSIGELVPCLYLIFLYRFETRATACNSKKAGRLLAHEIVKTSAPLGVSAQITSILQVLEDVLIISGLKKFGMPSGVAMENFGIIDGLVLPLLSFSLVILAPVASMLTAEIAKCYSCRNSQRISSLTSRTLKLTINFGIGLLAIFWTFPDQISTALYGNVLSSPLLKILAPLCPILCINLIFDAILNGLMEQEKLLKYNILVSTAKILMLKILIPRFGVKSLIFIFFASAMLSLYFMAAKILKQISIKIDLEQSFLLPALFCAVSIFTAKLYKPLITSLAPRNFGAIIGATIVVITYFGQILLAQRIYGII